PSCPKWSARRPTFDSLQRRTLWPKRKTSPARNQARCSSLLVPLGGCARLEVGPDLVRQREHQILGGGAHFLNVGVSLAGQQVQYVTHQDLGHGGSGRETHRGDTFKPLVLDL